MKDTARVLGRIHAIESNRGFGQEVVETLPQFGCATYKNGF